MCTWRLRVCRSGLQAWPQSRLGWGCLPRLPRGRSGLALGPLLAAQGTGPGASESQARPSLEPFREGRPARPARQEGRRAVRAACLAPASAPHLCSGVETAAMAGTSGLSEVTGCLYFVRTYLSEISHKAPVLEKNEGSETVQSQMHTWLLHLQSKPGPELP